MHRASYLKGMARAVDITHSIELVEWHDANVNVAFRSNVWTLNDASGRRPRNELFTSDEDASYLDEEKVVS